MLNRFLAMAIVIGALGNASKAVAQEATEMYIRSGNLRESPARRASSGQSRR
jgi:hypothetical protein